VNTSGPSAAEVKNAGTRIAEIDKNIEGLEEERRNLVVLQNYVEYPKHLPGHPGVIVQNAEEEKAVLSGKTKVSTVKSAEGDKQVVEKK
jgi:translation initiation factor IF-1